MSTWKLTTHALSFFMCSLGAHPWFVLPTLGTGEARQVRRHSKLVGPTCRAAAAGEPKMTLCPCNPVFICFCMNGTSACAIPPRSDCGH